MTDNITQSPTVAAPSTKPTRALVLPWSRILPIFEEGRIEDGVVAYVEEDGIADLSDIRTVLSHHMPVHGNYALMAAPNIMLANGLSRELAEFIVKLHDEGRIKIRPCGWHPNGGWKDEIHPFVGPALQFAGNFSRLSVARGLKPYARMRRVPWCLRSGGAQR